jgi:cytoskeletal protein CcmA (bactofilin family)
LLSGALLLLALPSSAFASEVRSGTAALVPPGETLDDDLFATGQTITIAGHVTGDVFATGQSVVVTGTVDGDLLAAAQQVTVDGTVNGDVYAAGAVVTVNGQVGHSVTGLAQQINVSSTGRVGGSLIAAGETVSAFGPIGRGLTVGGGTVQLGGPVAGNATLWSQTFTVGPNAHIGGKLDYHAEQPSQLPDGVVAGPVQFHQVERQQRQAPILNGLFDFWSLIGLVGSAIVGAVALMLAPRLSARAVEIGRQEPIATFGLGLLVLVGGPVLMVLAAVTLVGIPLAVVLAATYGISLVLAWPAIGLLVGTELARWLPRREPLPVLAALVVGLIVLYLFTHIPVVGGLIDFVAVTFGLGQLIQTVRRRPRHSEPARAATAPVPVPA